MATFLASVDPELAPSWQFRMEAYAGLEVTETGEISSKIDLSALETQRIRRTSRLLADGPLEPAELPPREQSTATHTGLLATSFVLVSVVSAAMAAIFVAALLTGLWFLAGSPPPPTP
jgi:hypothetical protein